MLLTRKAEFSASHSCYNKALSENQNLELYGELEGSFGHGHNYEIEVTVEGEPDPVTGMVVDLKLLKEVISSQVLDPMDHKHLNYEVPPFDKVVPTAENLVKEIWRRLDAHLTFENARLYSVRLYETSDLYVDYGGPQ
ncbi:MAG: 6-carboxytetrahydropterin synthase [Bryobacteraceae bacterium]|nr:6-carboxytetrahydropterin synthase [Bryobacteraceae bacterium]